MQRDVAPPSPVQIATTGRGGAGEHYAAQGNILVNGDTVGAMSETFEGATGSLATRLLQSLAAGQMTGGDRRGRQSANLLVVKPKGGYGGWSDRWLDLRVDDHPTPIAELKRLYTLHQLYFGEPAESELIPLSLELVTEVKKRLATLGFYADEINGLFDAGAYQAMAAWASVENLEERMRQDGKMDTAVLNRRYKDLDKKLVREFIVPRAEL